MVGEMRVYDPETNTYLPAVKVCAYDPTQLGIERFTPCADGETGLNQPLTLYIGRPGLSQDVILFNFFIE